MQFTIYTSGFLFKLCWFWFTYLSAVIGMLYHRPSCRYSSTILRTIQNCRQYNHSSGSQFGTSPVALRLYSEIYKFNLFKVQKHLCAPFTSSAFQMAPSVFKLKNVSPSELKPGFMKECEVDGVDDAKVLLLQYGKNLRATNTHCTHYNLPLVKGCLTEDGRVVCPLYVDDSLYPDVTFQQGWIASLQRCFEKRFLTAVSIAVTDPASGLALAILKTDQLLMLFIRFLLILTERVSPSRLMNLRSKRAEERLTWWRFPKLRMLARPTSWLLEGIHNFPFSMLIIPYCFIHINAKSIINLES